VAIAALILAGGAVIAWLQPAGPPAGYLDPGNTGPDGGHALAAILTQRGEQLTAAGNATDADHAAGNRATILVTNPQLLTAAELTRLRDSTADIVLAEPGQAALAALAPGVTQTGQAPVRTLDPGCALSAADLAGNADLGGTLLAATAQGAVSCYRSGGHPSLVRLRMAGRQITVLGSGAPFTNQHLGDHGNAALALNLLGSQPRLVWLTPAAAPAGPAGPPASGQATFTSLIPEPVYMVTIQLLVAVLLLALWRVRRLGPVVAERLPAVVRAAETTEGHGRLYHARRSRDRAAQVLRDAASARLLRGLDLPPDADPATAAALLAQRTGAPATDIAWTLAGPPPADDAALVALADRLDELERKAGAR